MAFINCSLLGERENAKEELLKRSSSLDSLQELSKMMIHECFLKVSRILKELFQKFLKRGAGAEPLLDKPKFEIPF